MHTYADRRISPFEGGWGDVLFKRCDILFTKCYILKVFTNHYIIPVLMLVYADHPIFPSHPPILMLVYADRRISPFEGGWGDVFDVLFKCATLIISLRINPSININNFPRDIRSFFRNEERHKVSNLFSLTKPTYGYQLYQILFFK